MFEYELKRLDLSEKREQQLKLPYIAKDVQTIRHMTEIYCHAHHDSKDGLCPECEDFYLYSVKRLTQSNVSPAAPLEKRSQFAAAARFDVSERVIKKELKKLWLIPAQDFS